MSRGNGSPPPTHPRALFQEDNRTGNGWKNDLSPNPFPGERIRTYLGADYDTSNSSRSDGYANARRVGLAIKQHDVPPFEQLLVVKILRFRSKPMYVVNKQHQLITENK